MPITQADIDRLVRDFEHDEQFKLDCLLVQQAIKEAVQPTLWDYIDATENQQKGLIK
jgi:hypothetical protein